MQAEENKLFTPMQRHAVALILEFLEVNRKDRKDLGQDLSDIQQMVARDLNTLRVQLPRRQGSTYLAHYFCNLFKCLVVCANSDMATMFEHEHQKAFNHYPQYVVPVGNIKDPSFSKINDKWVQKISKGLASSDVILFETHRIYSQNNGIKRLQREVGLSHSFVML